MRETIGNTLLFYIVLIILGAIILLLVASFSYSKAFKVKNKIINVIEKYDGFDTLAQNDVNSDLKAMGYRLNSSYSACPINSNGGILIYGNIPGNYHYCVYEHSINKGKYYTVISYMHFDLPLVGNSIAIPIRGESRVIYQGIQG